MKSKFILATALLALSQGAHAASLAEHLPAGAVMTVEMKDASGLVSRAGGLVSGLLGRLQGQSASTKPDAMKPAMQGVLEMLSGSVAKESALGVFTVGQAGHPFSLGLLGVTRLGKDTAPMAEMFSEGPGAKVGNYAFSRQGEMFVGASNNVLYFSTDKALLMGYLGRLSGKAAPRLLNSEAYTTPKKALGAQEVSMFLNFSAAAKVVRSQLAQVAAPRLFSPAVDALDTYGQYAGGLTSTNAGFSSASVQRVNAQGKDQTLYRLLTTTGEFHVQDIIPATVESAVARACGQESGAYLGRWLTRLDLYDPTGFLTDSQLATHLERSGQYLGTECATVALAGSQKAAYRRLRDPLAQLRTSVQYQSVSDMDAAKAQFPAYAESVNRALAGLTQSLPARLPADLQASDEDGLSGGVSELENMLGDLKKSLTTLKLVYAFQGNYLVTAYSEGALQEALSGVAKPLSQDEAFRASGLGAAGAGWSYQPNLPDLSEGDLQAALPALPELISGRTPGRAQPTFARLSSTKPKPASPKPGSADSLGQVFGLLAELINRYDGYASQSQVSGDLILSKTSIKYRW